MLRSIQLVVLAAAALVVGTAQAFVLPPLTRSSSRAQQRQPLYAEAPEGLQPPPPKPVLRVLGPDGKELRTFEATAGANLRKTLQAQKVDVYDLMGKMTNCNGAGQCGTCAVRIQSDAWGPRSEWEAGKLAKKYGSNEEYHLACQTLVQPGAATITLRPPAKK